MQAPTALREGARIRPLRIPTAPRQHALTRALRTAGRAEAEVLTLYMAGWSEADPRKIADATVAEYVFDDAFVGRFSSRTLPDYFGILRSRFGVAASTAQKDLAFTLCGPMDGPGGERIRQYWREASRLGLTGVSKISVTPKGIAADAVAYDLNMACEILRTAHEPDHVRFAEVNVLSRHLLYS